MQPQIRIVSDSQIMKIENFGEMQMRYQIMPLASRASAVISDAELAFSTVQRILGEMARNHQIKGAVSTLRNNYVIISRIRPSEAKTVLMDESVDFIQTTVYKLESWKKMLQNIAQGKAQATIIKDDAPHNIALTGASGYLAIVKLIISELAKLDKHGKETYTTMLAEMRRCTTILSDCECASEFNNVVLH